MQLKKAYLTMASVAVAIIALLSVAREDVRVL
jgi:hypothetical protein